MFYVIYIHYCEISKKSDSEFFMNKALLLKVVCIDYIKALSFVVQIYFHSGLVATGVQHRKQFIFIFCKLCYSNLMAEWKSTCSRCWNLAIGNILVCNIVLFYWLYQWFCFIYWDCFKFYLVMSPCITGILYHDVLLYINLWDWKSKQVHLNALISCLARNLDFRFILIILFMTFILL